VQYAYEKRGNIDRLDTKMTSVRTSRGINAESPLLIFHKYENASICHFAIYIYIYICMYQRGNYLNKPG
jgi:hypothetical protein